MINPIIVSFQLFGITFSIHWYGVLAALGVLVGGLITEKQIVRRGGKEGYLWDLLLWVVPAGIIGARLWYVINDIVGGGRYFLDDPIRILYITEGGLHIYGAIALGLLVAYIYTRRHPFDMALLLDSRRGCLSARPLAGLPTTSTRNCTASLPICPGAYPSLPPTASVLTATLRSTR